MSKTTYAYDTIKNLILTGKLQPLEELSEKDFQEKLNISRTPIREAFQALQHEGFIEIHPRKSICVSPITFHLLEEIFDTRILLEPALFRRACGKIPDEDLLEIRSKLLISPKNMTLSEQADYYNQQDVRLHRSILPYVNNHFVAKALSSVWDHETQIQNILFSVHTNNQVVDEHIAIINALLQRSEEDVETLVLIHAVNARKKAFLHFFDSTPPP